MKSRLTWVLAAALAAGVTGCVAQSERDKLTKLYRKSQEQVIDLQTQHEEKDASIRTLQEVKSPNKDLLQQLENAMLENDKLLTAMEDAEEQLREAALSPLPAQLSAALQDLAETNPQLMTYDPDRGMVKLIGDLTFALGSTDVNDNAAATLARLADVLNSPEAQPYEVHIVGHTDNMPIRHSRSKHPSNWHLSVHRSIAVKDVLERSGVAPTRMAVAGRGEFQPIAPNHPGGTPSNRRVEIYLVAESSSKAVGDQIAPAANESTAIEMREPSGSVSAQTDTAAGAPEQFK